MWKNRRNVFQDQFKYIHNGIVKPFQVGILHYDERFQEMHNLSKYLPPPPIKGKRYESDQWDVYNKEFSENDIRVVIKDGLPSSM